MNRRHALLARTVAHQRRVLSILDDDLTHAAFGQPDKQLRLGLGYDHNFVLNKPNGKAMTRAARVVEPVSGRVLELWTEEPGVQFYSGNFLDGSLKGKGHSYEHRTGFCLEPQVWPDAPNHPYFPQATLWPGDRYRQVTEYRFRLG